MFPDEAAFRYARVYPFFRTTKSYNSKSSTQNRRATVSRSSPFLSLLRPECFVGLDDLNLDLGSSRGWLIPHSNTLLKCFLSRSIFFSFLRISIS